LDSEEDSDEQGAETMSIEAMTYVALMGEMQVLLDGERILSNSMRDAYVQSQLELEKAKIRIQELEQLLAAKEQRP
jgi:hypothetical protein